MIRVIFNADDFGFTRDVNEGIVEANRDGVLGATTLMANGEAFEHAVTLARKTPALDVGVHLVMVQGESVSQPGQPLPSTLAELAQALLLRRIDPKAEAEAQVRKILSAGIRPGHIDAHKHSHLFPPVLRALTHVARKFGIPWARKPFDHDAESGVARAMKVMQPSMTNRLAGLQSTDHFAGFELTGKLNTVSMVRALEALPAGLTEFMCHPGHCTAELQNAPTRLKQSRAIELAALTSPEVRQTIERRGIIVTRFSEIG